MTNANLQFADPTEALNAMEQALREANDELCLLARHRRIELPQVDKNMIAAIAHLATLKQQVADLVAFREAHEWRPTPDGSTKNGDRGIVGIWSNILNDWLYISDAVYCCDSEITKLAWRDSEGEALESDLSAGRVTFYMPLTPPAAEGGHGGG